MKGRCTIKRITMSKHGMLSEWLNLKGCKIVSEGNRDFTSEFLELVRSMGMDTPRKQRVRAEVPKYQRCQAYKANGEQCTRRRRTGCELCGTHVKGTPHGRLNLPESGRAKTKRYLTCVKEVNGINYHVDTQSAVVYMTEDILSGNREPRVIGSYKVVDGCGSIAYTPME